MSNGSFYRVNPDSQLANCSLPSPRHRRVSISSARTQGSSRGKRDGKENKAPFVSGILRKQRDKTLGTLNTFVHDSVFHRVLKLLDFLFLGVIAFRICVCMCVKMGVWEKTW